MNISTLGNANDLVSHERFSNNREVEQVNTFQAALAAAAEANDSAAIRHAAIEFESFFLSQIFGQMRRSVDLFSPEERSAASEIYQKWFDDKIAEVSAQRGGIGLADFIYRQMTSFSSAVDVNSFLSIVQQMNMYGEPETDE